MFRRRKKTTPSSSGVVGKTTSDVIGKTKKTTTILTKKKTQQKNNPKDRWGDKSIGDQDDGPQSHNAHDSNESRNFVVEEDDSIISQEESINDETIREDHHCCSRSFTDADELSKQAKPTEEEKTGPAISLTAMTPIPATAADASQATAAAAATTTTTIPKDKRRIPRQLQRKVRVFPSIFDEDDVFAIDSDDYVVACDLLSLVGSTTPRHRRLRAQDVVTIAAENYENDDRRVSELRVPSVAKELPASLGGLEHLTTLDCSNTYQLQELCEEVFGLVGLQKMVLQRSAIISLPSSIGRLRNLVQLDLSSTKRLMRLPETIGELAGLTRLDLQHSGIMALPSTIGKLENLRRLDLSFTNELLSLPDSIGNLVSLRELKLQHSEIKTIPASLGRLRKLERLDLSFSSKLIQVPEDAIGGLTNLMELDLQNTGIVSLPASIGRLRNLRLLDLSRTHPVLKLPGENGKLYKLYQQTKTCWSLGSFGRLVDIDIGFAIWNNTPHARNLYFMLAHNRARMRLLRHFPNMPPSLWPHLLSRGTRAFGDFALAEGDPRTMAHLMARRETLVSGQDAIFQLLRHGTESFVGVLLHHRRRERD